MGKKSYTKGEIRIHHLIAKAKQAYLVARMGVGKDCKDYQEDLWNLEAFQEAKWGSSRKRNAGLHGQTMGLHKIFWPR